VKLNEIFQVFNILITKLLYLKLGKSILRNYLSKKYPEKIFFQAIFCGF